MSTISPIFSTDGYKEKGIIENSDSTGKKLIYQIPFSEVNEMQVILKRLEDTIDQNCYIDVEMNSLEDAYINIAKEEENLLKNLKKYGMRRLTDVMNKDPTQGQGPRVSIQEEGLAESESSKKLNEEPMHGEINE